MLLTIAFGLFVVLFILSIALLIATGFCIAVANLMAYFIPTLDLSSTLVPAAILTTVTVITVGSVLKVWIAESGLRSLHRYDEDDDVEDDKPEQPIVTRRRTGKYRVK